MYASMQSTSIGYFRHLTFMLRWSISLSLSPLCTPPVHLTHCCKTITYLEWESKKKKI